MRLSRLIYIVLVFFILMSCKSKTDYYTDFNNVNDRVWIGNDFWSIPLEDWKVEDGKLQSIAGVRNSRVNILTHLLAQGKGNFEVSLMINLTSKGKTPGSAGLLLGIVDKEDSDVRAASYFGKETVKAGVSLNGFAFLNDQRVQLPDEFDINQFKIKVKGNNKQLKLEITDRNGISPELLSCNVDDIYGLIAIANNMISDGPDQTGISTFSFDDLRISGTKVIEKPENSFGPILWTMYTLSKNSLKLMALLPPVGEADNKDVSLQLKDNNESWVTVATQPIEPDSRTAVFKLENWNATQTVKYRVEYIEKRKDQTEMPYYYEGVIQEDPVDRPLVLGALTCQHSSGFPYTPLVENLGKLNPDLLYFSGDQIYEGNGGYPIKREPEDISILNYLGKYYMFGWAFGDLMRDRPTICTPDDHDVYHGNLWGESGEPMDENATSTGSFRGFIQSVKMVNVVNRTHCGQLPDPYDPTPIKQGMSVWYTDLTYGRISFAIVSDRIFKTGPESVAENWEGRNDHLKEPLKDMSVLDNNGYEMLGDRQMKFLSDWIMGWDETDMKVLLSQTVYANVATHHGAGALEGRGDGILLGDLDSGGWPKSARDEALKLIRKASTFHINGDQHIPTLVQYGIDDFRDGGWSFCTPAISVGYQRWFLPDLLGFPIEKRPEHNNTNTGNYIDGFGNKNYVYAVGNPSTSSYENENRYTTALLKASGFGIIEFDQNERTIVMDSWRFNADIENPNPVRDQFPGWPFEISQFDNLGIGAENVLPEFTVNKPNQLMQIWNEKTGELAHIYRIKGDKVQPKINESGLFTILIGENENSKKITGIESQLKSNKNNISINLE